VAIAVVAATAALWLAFHVRKLTHRIAAALVMGGAVCSMHYTGMAAATLVCTTANRNAFLPGVLRPADLGMLVTLLAVGVAAMVLLDALVQRMTAGSNRVAATRI
jgi:NO-binding membrane sensor protein with MHYT domain